MTASGGSLHCASWHGKLPSAGDFVARRMEPAFVERWDAWLSESLTNLQQRQDWLAQYLQCPAWRYLLMPGVIDQRTWCGVLMPSVDRVGRYYPLTLAMAWNDAPGAALAASHFGWLASLEEVAYAALQEEWTADALEERLLQLAAPETAGDAQAPAGLAWHSHLGGKSCWYAHAAGESPRLLVCDGLDAQELGPALFTPASAQ